MNLSEFARARGVQPQAVSRYINRHKELFENHIEKNGKSKEIDDIAFDLLDKQYPSLSPVQIIEDSQTLRELAEARKKINEMRDEKDKLQEQLDNFQLIEIRQQMLEADLNKKDEQIKEMNEKYIKLEVSKAVADEKIINLEEELDKEKNKSWWAKLRGK